MKKTLAFFIVMALVVACRKEKPVGEPPERPDPVSHYVLNPDSATLATFLYDPGTWWVYRDMQDNSRDSIWVTGNGPMTIFFHDFPGTPGTGFTSDNTYNYHRVNLAGNTHESNQIEIVSTGLYVRFSPPIAYYGYYGTQLAFYDSLQLQGTWYYNVTKQKPATMFYNGYEILSPDNVFYLNEDYGIIKKEIVDTASGAINQYELIHANIVR